MQFKANVYVGLKPTVNDPQGITIRGGLRQLGFDGVSTVRSGKHIVVWLEASDHTTAERQVESMCSKLLANPVIEDYSYEVTEAVEPIS